MQATSKKQLIINAFQQMDIYMLEILLNDNQTYQDAHKDAFIEKLSKAFNAFKNSNITSLMAFKGLCASTKCSNKGCSGYSFVGVNSKSHLDVVFEETEEDFKDIYECSNLQINETVEREDKISIDIFDDDKPNFKPTIETLAKMQHCEKACAELINHETLYLDKNDYIYWLEKYKPIYATLTIFTRISQLHKFYWLYNRLAEYAAYLQQEPAAKTAINEYELLELENEKLLLQWLVKYEKVNDALVLFLDLDFMTDEEIKGGYLSLSRDYKLQLAISDFDIVYKFKKIYNRHYNDAFEKYKTFELEELNDPTDSNHAVDNYTTLSYHLKQRGLL